MYPSCISCFEQISLLLMYYGRHTGFNGDCQYVRINDLYFYTVTFHLFLNRIILILVFVVGNDVIFLDPHTTQSIGVVESKEQEHERKMDSSYHCQQANRLHILHMDPSVAVVSCIFYLLYHTRV